MLSFPIAKTPFINLLKLHKMKIIVFEQEAYYKMLGEFKKLIKDLAAPQPKEWLSPNEAKNLLGFRSKSKLQQLRDYGEIVFSQHGRVIRYSRSSIISFLEKNIVKNHRKNR
ncbi:MAG: hypothetical protein COB65_02990 [Thalassobium sp.]|nr:MAG: hypothetical protein COB65_02990 [Thalassobium sp.]